MSEGKTFSRTYRFSGETIRKLLEVQQQRNFPSITLALETIIAEGHDALSKRDSLSKTEEKPSVDQEVKDQPKEAPEEKPPQRTQEETIKDLLANRCDHCISEPFADKDGRLHIYCPKPIFKPNPKNPDGKWIPSGKFHGKIPIEQCMSTQRYRLEKREKEISREGQAKETEEEEQEEGLETPEPSIPNKPKQSIDEIVDQLAVCLNPFIMRERPLLCHVCRKKQPDKWQACQEIQRELETSPSAMQEFVDNMKAKTIEARKAMENPYWFWKESRKTEDMTIQEIEEELGQRPSTKRRSCSEFCTDFKIMNCPKWPSCELNKPVSTPPSHQRIRIAKEE